MKFSIKFPVDLITFTEEILNGKLQFLCSASDVFTLAYLHLTVPNPHFCAAFRVNLAIFVAISFQQNTFEQMLQKVTAKASQDLRTRNCRI